MSELKEYKITTTLVCIVEAENKEQAQEEFDNLSDYGYVDDCNIEEVSDDND